MGPVCFDLVTLWKSGKQLFCKHERNLVHTVLAKKKNPQNIFSW